MLGGESEAAKLRCPVAGVVEEEQGVLGHGGMYMFRVQFIVWVMLYVPLSVKVTEDVWLSPAHP